ncbi:unnamed protein product, partial [Closterium sp. Naga37s-1]
MARQEQPGDRGSDEAERLHPDGPFEANHINGQANGHAESHEGSRMLNGDSHVVVDVDVRGRALQGTNRQRGLVGPATSFKDVRYKVQTAKAGSWDPRHSCLPTLPALPAVLTSKRGGTAGGGGAVGGAGGGAEAGAAGKAGAEVREKEILHGISGSVAPGEVLAMMGPSGGGKTTFLNVLGGRFKQGNMAGTLTYNDLPYSKALKRKLGFVNQDDIFFPRLILRETLIYAAVLRLPKELTSLSPSPWFPLLLLSLGFVTQDDIFFPHLTVRETLMYAAVLRLPKELSWADKVQRADETITELGLDKCRNTVIGGPFLRGISGGERKRVSIGHEILINPSMLLLDEPTSGLDSTTALRIIQVIQNLAKSGRTVVTTIHQPSSRLFHAFDKLLLLSEGNAIFFGQAADAMVYFGRLGFEQLFAMNPADFLLDLATGTTADVRLPGVFGESEEWQEKSVLEQQHDVKEVTALGFICGMLWFGSERNTATEIQDQVGLLFFISMFWGFFPLVAAIFTFPQLYDLPMEWLLPTLFLLIAYFMASLKLTAGAFFGLLFSTYLIVTTAQVGGDVWFGAVLFPSPVSHVMCLCPVLLLPSPRSSSSSATSWLPSSSLPGLFRTALLNLPHCHHGSGLRALFGSSSEDVKVATFMLAGGNYRQTIPAFYALMHALPSPSCLM